MKSEEIIIEVDSDRKQELLDLLSKIDFVKIQTDESLINDFLKSSPPNVLLTQEEIDDLVFEERYARRRKQNS